MGKWNYRRTWRPKNYYRDQRIPSPPTYYDTEFKLRGTWKNIDLPWEERFCISVGIPWEKVVNAEKYANCYDNVLKWNDSAGESAFYEAKKRFWAQINNIPTDVPQPDPEMYNEEIDWNPKIDLELVKELDLAYFNPDEAEKLESYNATKRNDGFTPGCILGLNDINPWERNKNDDRDCLNKSENKNISDPWERGITQDDREIKDRWEVDGHRSWNQNATWGNSARDAGNNEITWGISATNSWHYNQYRVQREDENSKNTWARKETGWQSSKNSYANTSRGAQQHQAPNRQRENYRDYTSFGRGTNASCRKREGGYEYTTSYKSARVQSYGYREHNQY
ncbi:hypothetical protein L1987_62986 [Smallanthus sonchifolius]|uniref:Uncharacterized protein n=1 Tax=Smallanthus sonchifolius TaxID=185202 RepID=A0ACB9CC10_9ASTR|nr:hypothetical protein L1987_62986 [Smallanthus sonchifolius]